MNPLPVDVAGCFKRLQQHQIAEEIRRLQQEVAVSLDLQDEDPTPAPDLQEKLALLNELHKKLREEFPTFSGLR